MDINVLSIYSSVGIDLQELLMDADTAARHEFVIVNNKMMPYATQTSICAGEVDFEPFNYPLPEYCVKNASLIQIDVIVFADTESELRYLALNTNNHFFINREQFQRNN